MRVMTWRALSISPHLLELLSSELVRVSLVRVEVLVPYTEGGLLGWD